MLKASDTCVIINQKTLKMVVQITGTRLHAQTPLPGLAIWKQWQVMVNNTHIHLFLFFWIFVKWQTKITRKRQKQPFSHHIPCATKCRVRSHGLVILWGMSFFSSFFWVFCAHPLTRPHMQLPSLKPKLSFQFFSVHFVFFYHVLLNN